MSDYYNNNAPVNGGALGWEDEINDDHVDLQPGTYQFRVMKLTRGRHDGADWMPPCNKVEAELVITEPTTGEDVIIRDTLYLHVKGKWKICKFFESLGIKKKGEPLKMTWNIIGRTGWANTILKEGSRGGKFANIKSYISAEEMTAQPQMSQPMGTPASSAPQAPAAPNWTPGAF